MSLWSFDPAAILLNPSAVVLIIPSFAKPLYSFDFNGICVNLAEAQLILKEVQKQGGVSLAKVEIIEELICEHDWMAKEVRKRAFAKS
jgi:hypothetical protein